MRSDYRTIYRSGTRNTPPQDFGAGAYYYADIPQFAKYVDGSGYTSPVSMWVLIALFLIWGFFMYKLWGWIEKKDK